MHSDIHIGVKLIWSYGENFSRFTQFAKANVKSFASIYKFASYSCYWIQIYFGKFKQTYHITLNSSKRKSGNIVSKRRASTTWQCYDIRIFQWSINLPSKKLILHTSSVGIFLCMYSDYANIYRVAIRSHKNLIQFGPEVSILWAFFLTWTIYTYYLKIPDPICVIFLFDGRYLPIDSI